ncbi:MAG: D-alanyl-D-alanine carboxypeptidase [Defluviitaleaceae bacterium]|nr:D-alanyl-D-alanine carboxypeptidase [Defluviitaleaceae bacterium]
MRTRATRVRRGGNRVFGGILLILTVVVLLFGAAMYIIGIIASAEGYPIEFEYPAENPEPVEVTIRQPESEIMPEIFLNSTNAILIDLESGEILLYRNGTDRIYPASLVKMMTALVAIENIGSINEPVLLREGIFPPIHDANATTAGFLPGETVRAIDLLFGLLLPSGAECAIGLAEHVAGTEQGFVALMNEKAKEIGMNDTSFTNTTGLHDSRQYSTVRDMAVLLKYALENETFERIITASRHSTADTSGRPGGITFHSTLFSRMYSPEFPGGAILGGRTGFTSQAGQNLASFALINGRTYILVTSGAFGNHFAQALHIDDAFSIYETIGTKES